MRKGLRIFLSVFVLVIVVVLVIAAGIGSRDNVTGKWFQQPDVTKWFYSWGKEADDHSEDNIQIMSYSLFAEDYADYGISEQAIKAGVLTAEYTPSNTTNKRTGWTYRWAGNGWSQNEILSDYVIFTPGANYAPELTYEVLQPFGDTIIVECTSRANPALKATTRIDYMARYTEILDGCSYELSYGEDLDLLYELYCDDYYSIVPDNIIVKTAHLEFMYDFQQYVGTNYGWDVEAWDYQDITSLDWNTVAWSGLQSAAAAYYNATGSTSIWHVEVTVECYYKGELLYSFDDEEEVGFTSSAFELMAVPPTGVTTPDQVIL